jgi:hypothetical protein
MSKLKTIFEDEQTTVSEVDVNELHKHISKKDAHMISDIIFDVLIDMGIKQDGFSWDINVTVEQNNVN